MVAGAAHKDDRLPEQPKQHGSVKFGGSQALQSNVQSELSLSKVVNTYETQVHAGKQAEASVDAVGRSRGKKVCEQPEQHGSINAGAAQAL